MSTPRWSKGSVPSSHARGQRFEPPSQYLFQLTEILCTYLSLSKNQWAQAVTEVHNQYQLTVMTGSVLLEMQHSTSERES